MSIKSVAAKVWNTVRHEPVAVWGLLAAAALNFVALQFGLSAHWVDLISTGLMFAGIPVVRSKTKPVALLKQAAVDVAAQVAKDAKKA